jgi:hypothetical protein
VAAGVASHRVDAMITMEMTPIMSRVYRLASRLGEFAPYLAIELILPGGSMLALALWLYRRNRQQVEIAARTFLTRDPPVA